MIGDAKTYILAGNKKENIFNSYSDFKNGNYKHGRIPELWDGNAVKRIVNILLGRIWILEKQKILILRM